VYDGVDPARVAGGDRQRGRRSLGISDGQLLLLTVAKLTDCKGHAFLLEALPGVLKRYPQAIAVFAGDGQLRGELQSHAARLGIEAKVRLVGYRHDVPDLIQAADLFVLPSDREGLCSTLIDVMLAGRPLVTTSAGGIPELTGSSDPAAEPLAWTVPPRDPKALAAAILSALDHPDRQAAFAHRARQRAERLFTADRMVESTLQVYHELREARH
jgi:glycosyltransferase involved in cell wall biosynthesis